jgi:hypothetical protein
MCLNLAVQIIVLGVLLMLLLLTPDIATGQRSVSDFVIQATGYTRKQRLPVPTVDVCVTAPPALGVLLHTHGGLMGGRGNISVPAAVTAAAYQLILLTNANLMLYNPTSCCQLFCMFLEKRYPDTGGTLISLVVHWSLGLRKRQRARLQRRRQAWCEVDTSPPHTVFVR